MTQHLGKASGNRAGRKEKCHSDEAEYNRGESGIVKAIETQRLYSSSSAMLREDR